MVCEKNVKKMMKRYFDKTARERTFEMVRVDGSSRPLRTYHLNMWQKWGHPLRYACQTVWEPTTQLRWTFQSGQMKSNCQQYN